MKNVKKNTNLVEKCATCGRETPHYVNAKGEVRCAICQTVSRIASAPKEIVFEADEEFDGILNPATVVDTVDEPEVVEVPEEFGPTFEEGDEELQLPL